MRLSHLLLNVLFLTSSSNAFPLHQIRSDGALSVSDLPLTRRAPAPPIFQSFKSKLPFSGWKKKSTQPPDPGLGSDRNSQSPPGETPPPLPPRRPPSPPPPLPPRPHSEPGGDSSLAGQSSQGSKPPPPPVPRRGSASSETKPTRPPPPPVPAPKRDPPPIPYDPASSVGRGQGGVQRPAHPARLASDPGPVGQGAQNPATQLKTPPIPSRRPIRKAASETNLRGNSPRSGTAEAQDSASGLKRPEIPSRRPAKKVKPDGTGSDTAGTLRRVKSDMPLGQGSELRPGPGSKATGPPPRPKPERLRSDPLLAKGRPSVAVPVPPHEGLERAQSAPPFNQGWRLPDHLEAAQSQLPTTRPAASSNLNPFRKPQPDNQAPEVEQGSPSATPPPTPGTKNNGRIRRTKSALAIPSLPAIQEHGTL